MLRLLTDENFNSDLVAGLLRAEPELDLVRAKEVGLVATADREILEWCAVEGRVLLSHDRNTMTAFANERIVVGLKMPGVIIVKNARNLGRLISELLIIVCCSESYEWEGRVDFVS